MDSTHVEATPEEPAEKRLGLESTHIGNYIAQTRQPVYSLLFLTPLLVAYECYAYFINFNKPYQIRNGADILLKEFFRRFGIDNLFSMMMVTLVAILVIVGISYRRMRQPLVLKFFPLMFVESLIYAVLLGPVTQKLTGFVQHPFAALDASGPVKDFPFKLLVSLGAGVYEELVFRVFLISALLYLFERVLRFEFLHAAGLAILFSSVIFSGFHYVGRFHWEFSFESFLYRAVAGMVLSGLYIARGLGVTAWTHSLYDIYVLLVTGN